MIGPWYGTIALFIGMEVTFYASHQRWAFESINSILEHKYISLSKLLM